MLGRVLSGPALFLMERGGWKMASPARKKLYVRTGKVACSDWH